MTQGRVVVLKEYSAPFVIEEYEVPNPEPGAIILETTQAGICGSDLHRWRGDMIANPLPGNGFLAGHEGTGVVHKLGEGRGADIALELVGRAELLVEGISYLTNGGTFVEIGDIVSGRTVAFDPSTMLRGKKIVGSSLYRPSIIPMIMEMLVKNRDRVPYHKIVSNTYPLAEVNRAFEEAEWNERQTPVSRGMLVP